jgi:hypothetical protein
MVGGEETMRELFGGALAALSLSAGTSALAAPTLSGEYVEARTCSVYTGACHANGERVTIGREAIMAWNIKGGLVNGVKLDGVNVIAVVAADANLAEAYANRRAVLYVDEKATPAQREAAIAALKKQYGKALGEVVAVKAAPVQFSKSGLEYTVRIPNVAYLKTTRYACDHCVMPHQTWYDPFVGLKSSIVAKAAVSEFKGTSELKTSWSRTDENSSFVGDFAF